MIVEEPSENYISGWVKLFRSLKNKAWYRKSEYVHIWIHLILRANHKPCEWVFKGQSFHVNRGQFITSRKSISDETGVSESTVERILRYFENEQQIEQQNLFTSRLISIVSYENYQTSEQLFEQQVNSKRTASEQQVDTNKNTTIQEVKKQYTKIQLEKFEKFDSWLTVNAETVKKMKAPFTPKSYESCVAFFVKEFKGDEVTAKNTMSDLLKNMHNNITLLKKNRDANLTIRNWYRMGKERKSGTKAPVNEDGRKPNYI